MLNMFNELVNLVGNTDVAISIVGAAGILLITGIDNEVKHHLLRRKYSWLRK